MITNEKLRNVVILIFMVLPCFLFGYDTLPVTVCETAQAWATEHSWGIIDNGLAYWGADQDISAWIFTAYRKTEPFPNETTIKNDVKRYWEFRLQAENNLKTCIVDNNRSGIMQAQEQIQNMWASMRNAEAFATIIVTENPYPHVAMAYPGLPPHYVSILDAEAQAKNILSIGTVNLKRYYFVDPLNIFAEFKAEEEKTFINIILLGKEALPSIDKINSGMDDIKDRYLEKSIVKTMSTVEKIINEVPDYNSSWPTLYYPGFPNNGIGYCRQVSSAMVLGYWNDRGYDKLIDDGGAGGGSDDVGSRFGGG